METFISKNEKDTINFAKNFVYLDNTHIMLIEVHKWKGNLSIFIYPYENGIKKKSAI